MASSNGVCDGGNIKMKRRRGRSSKKRAGVDPTGEEKTLVVDVVHKDIPILHMRKALDNGRLPFTRSEICSYVDWVSGKYPTSDAVT